MTKNEIIAAIEAELVKGKKFALDEHGLTIDHAVTIEKDSIRLMVWEREVGCSGSHVAVSGDETAIPARMVQSGIRALVRVHRSRVIVKVV